MTRTLPNGIGETLGDIWLTTSPLLLDGEVLFVDSTNADASDSSNYGRSRGKPFATLAYAVTQAENGDIIALLDGHTETVSTEIDVDVSIIIAAAGQSDGKPTVKLTGPPATGTAMLLISANHVQVRNIWFEAFASAQTAHHIELGEVVNCVISGCYFEADENNNSECIDVVTDFFGDDHVLIENCTFVSTASDPADQPTAAINIDDGNMEVVNCTFDDGSVGWSTNAVNVSGACTIRARGVSLLNGATFEYYEDATDFVNISASAPDGLGGKVERNN